MPKEQTDADRIRQDSATSARLQPYNPTTQNNAGGNCLTCEDFIILYESDTEVHFLHGTESVVLTISMVSEDHCKQLHFR